MSSRSQNSTTGRSFSHRGARVALGALQSVAPAVAGRLAARLFMTPPRRRKAGRGREELAGRVPFAVETPGATLRGVRVGSGPAVLLVHGWGGRGDQLAAFAPPLLEAGCSVVAFDGPAHGASTGRTTSMPELAGAIGAVAARFRPRAAVGHSLGGAALALALHRGLALDAAVLVAPPRTPTEWLEAFSAHLRLDARTRDALRLRIERRVGVRMAELAVPRLAEALRTPALVVHDRGDGEVPWDDGAAVAAAWPGARLLSTSGLGHRRILRDARIVAEATTFLVDRLERCGCGRLAAAVAQGAPVCEGCSLERYLADKEARAPGAAA